MARSSKVDAIEKFRFTVSYDGQVRAGFSEVSTPKYTVTKGEYREGNAPDNVQLFPGLVRCEDVVLSRGVTTNQDFYDWMKQIFDPMAIPDGLKQAVQDPNELPQVDDNKLEYRKELIITVYHRNGQPVKRWTLRNVFPVAFQPGSDLNASEDGEKSIEQLTIGYESFDEEKGSEIDGGLDMDAP